MFQKIIGWGVGYFFEKYYGELDEELVYVIDNDKNKQGARINGITVFGPDILKCEDSEQCLIIVFCDNYSEIYDNIGHYGDFEAIDIITYLLVENLQGKPRFLLKSNSAATILSVACPEAIWKINGCHKLMESQNHLILERNYSHIVIAPISVRKRENRKDDIVAVIYNDNFEGFYRLQEFIRYKNSYQGVIIHSLFREEGVIAPLLNNIDVRGKILYFLHDYYIICRYRFLYLKNEFCLDNKEVLRCSECKVREENEKRYGYLKNIFKKHHVLLIAPSETVKRIVRQVYVEEEILVIPHLTYVKKTCSKKINYKKKIAYVGLASPLKGWDEFIKIVKALHGLYDFYCLGSCGEEQRVEGVTYVSVGSPEAEFLTMNQALTELEIDIAYLGSLCPETYSYTYYECFEEGIFVITNVRSGNIAEEVLRNGNGKVFTCTAEMIEWLSLTDEVHSCLSIPGMRLSGIKPNEYLLQIL